MKRCETCGESKPYGEFATRVKTQDGFAPWCLACWRARHAALTAQSQKAIRTRITEYIRHLKDGPCVDCGCRYPWYVMQFDHVRGVKEFTISHAVRVSRHLRTIRAEIAKCDLVCANCHAERTHQRRQDPAIHDSDLHAAYVTQT